MNLNRADKARQPFDVALGRSLRAASESSGADCPGPELLAAYYDRSLARAERERLEAHFSRCARCQAALAAIARADEGAAIERATARERGWRPGWRVAIPALAAMLVVVVVSVMRRGGRESPPEQLAALSRAEPSTQPETAAKAQPPAAAELALNEAKSAAPAPSATAAPNAPMLGFKLNIPVRPQKPALELPREAERLLAAPAQAPRPLAYATSAPAGVRAPVAGGAVAGLAASPGGYGTAGSAVTAQAAPSGTRPMEPNATQRWVIVSSQAGAPLWRLGDRGMVEYSADGTTWRAEHSGVEGGLLAGAAPSPTVCWAVGRAGTVIRTVDGEHWEKIASPTGADLVRVAAESADSASVSAADGSSFTTFNGGKTWTPK